VQVWSRRDQRRLSRTFPKLAAAKAWKRDAEQALAAGEMVAGTSGQTIRQAGEALIAAMRSGVVRTRSGRTYKPSAIRTFESNLELHVYPALGPYRLHDVRRGDVQRLADRLLATGRSPSTVRNALMPLRVVYRRAISLEETTVNPTSRLDLPAVEGTRDRFATPEEAEVLIGALLPSERALWATAFYAGLRRGELAALQVADVDLDGNVIHVRRGWDRVEGEIELKSARGRRDIPISRALRRQLVEHLMQLNWRDGYIFGRGPGRPWSIEVPQRRAARRWARVGLVPIGLHAARHTFASLMIAAMSGGGKFNAKVLQELMGHASITETFDRYGHLFPGTQDEAVALLDAYLERRAHPSRS
jgi:integrase